MKRRGWNVVSAPIALVAIGRAQLTGTPSFTSAAARFRFSGVMRLIVPSSSSCPQRPQLLRLEIILTTSLSVRVVATGVLLGGPQAGSGLEVLERHRLPLHPEPEVRHEDEVGMRAPRDERVALAAEELRRGVAVRPREVGHAGRGHEGPPLPPRSQNLAEGPALLVAALGRRLGRQVDVDVEWDEGDGRLRHREVERHVEGVVERRVLRVDEIEPPLDPRLDEGAGDRLVDPEPVTVAPERPRALRPHVDGERGHRAQEERLDVVPRDHGDRVRPERLEPPLDPRERGVHAQHELAVLGLGSGQELGRVRAREGADQHGAHARAAASITYRGMMSRAAMTGRGEVPIRSSPTIESSMYASRRSMPVRPTNHSTAPRAASSVASSTVGPKPRTCTVSSTSRIGRSSFRPFSSSTRARTVASHSTPVPVMIPSLIAACGSAKNSSAPSTITGRWTRLPARTSFWSKSPP